VINNKVFIPTVKVSSSVLLQMGCLRFAAADDSAFYIMWPIIRMSSRHHHNNGRGKDLITLIRPMIGTTSMDLHPTLEHNTIIDIIGWLSRPTQLYIHT
jgi:hypothetical protein